MDRTSRTEPNWSKYQDRQLDVLLSLQSSFDKNLAINNKMYTNMSNMELAIRSIANSNEVNAKNITSITKHFVGKAEEFVRDMKSSSESAKNFSASLDTASSSSKKFSNEMDESAKKTRNFINKFGSDLAAVGKNIADYLGGLRGIGEKVNKLSEYSNEMIKHSGMSGDRVRGFRSDIIDIVSDLNMSTGLAYSPTESYGAIISMSKGVTNSLEAITEMAKPLLLAQESLDTEIGGIADLFNRFYTRYNFSSRHMESTLDEIRGNTAGNSANAEATLENMKILENWVVYSANGDADKLEEMMKSVSHYTSWLTSMGIDSKPYTQYLKDIAYGDVGENRELLNILSRSGISAPQAQDMARTGQYEPLTKALLSGISEIFENNEDSFALGKILDNYGLDRDMAFEARNVMNSSGYISLEDFIEKANSESQASLKDLVEDKYVSAEDKAIHWLEGIYSKLADVQEKLGIGVSDIAIIAMLLKGTNVGKSIKGLFSKGSSVSAPTSLGGGGGATGMLPTASTSAFNNATWVNRIGGGLAHKGALASTGTGIATIAGGAAGLAIGIGGGIEAYNYFKEGENTEGTLAATGAGLGTAGGALTVALGASNPIGWAVMAVGAAGLVAAKVVENVTAISGNAVKVEEDIEELGKSLKDENKNRLKDISELNYAFNRESDLTKQRELLLESGLFKEEEIINASENEMQKLIDSYKNAASAMNDVTEGVLELAKKYYSEQQDEQQKDFIKELKGANLSASERNNVIEMLLPYVQDEKTVKKMEKALKDEKITEGEFADILTGGRNSWLDTSNIQDKSLDVAGMQLIAGMLGWDKEYVSSANMEKVASLFNALEFAHSSKGDTKAAWQAILDSGLEDEVRDVYGDRLKILGYATGTNYIPHDQLALVHEGEAIVPKKYNPAANSEEFKSLARQLREEAIESARIAKEQTESIVAELKEIRSFMSKWKESNEKDARLSEIKNKYSASKAYINEYMPIHV